MSVSRPGRSPRCSGRRSARSTCSWEPRRKRPGRRQVAAEPLDQGKTLAGILALLVAEREERLSDDKSSPVKTEVLLASSGLTAGEIAQLMGKNLAAVRKTIQ